MKLPKNSTQASPENGFTQVQMDKLQSLVSRLKSASAPRGASKDESVGSGSPPKLNFSGLMTKSFSKELSKQIADGYTGYLEWEEKEEQKPSLTQDMQKLYQKQIDDYVRWMKEEQDKKMAGVGGLGGLGSGRSSIGSIGGVVDLTPYGIDIVVKETGPVGKSDQREFVFKNRMGNIVGLFYGKGGDMIHINGGTIPGLPECQLYVIPKIDNSLYGGFRLEVSNQGPVTTQVVSNTNSGFSHMLDIIKANLPLLNETQRQELYQTLYDMGCRIGKGIKIEDEVSVQREIQFKELMPEVR